VTRDEPSVEEVKVHSLGPDSKSSWKIMGGNGVGVCDGAGVEVISITLVTSTSTVCIKTSAVGGGAGVQAVATERHSDAMGTGVARGKVVLIMTLSGRFASYKAWSAGMTT